MKIRTGFLVADIYAKYPNIELLVLGICQQKCVLGSEKLEKRGCSCTYSTWN